MIKDLILKAVAHGATQKQACSVLGLDPRTVQRWSGHEDGDQRKGPKSAPKNKLAPSERAAILSVLNSPEFRDLPPNIVVAILADRGTYLASESTQYRLLREAGLLNHRTPAKPPVKRYKPREATALAPNQVWSWDITYLSTDVRGLFFRLYMIMDVFSRKIVGWSVHEEELSEHAARLIEHATQIEGVRAGLILHSDNGAPMKGATMIATLERLGVVPSFSRPSVSNDNPYSESLFKTVKYCPDYPPRGIFTSLTQAREWVAQFVDWYNNEHRHSGIKYVTPNERHERRDTAILAKRASVYAAAKEKNPERWSGSARDWSPITEVRLNPDCLVTREPAA